MSNPKPVACAVCEAPLPPYRGWPTDGSEKSPHGCENPKCIISRISITRQAHADLNAAIRAKVAEAEERGCAENAHLCKLLEHVKANSFEVCVEGFDGKNWFDMRDAALAAHHGAQDVE